VHPDLVGFVDLVWEVPAEVLGATQLLFPVVIWFVVTLLATIASAKQQSGYWILSSGGSAEG